MTQSEKQVGGDHYKGAELQPLDLADMMDLNAYQVSIVKYLTRFKKKNGKEDLMKAAHYCLLGKERCPKNHADFSSEASVSLAERYAGCSVLWAGLTLSIAKQEWDEVLSGIDRISMEAYKEHINV